MSYPSSHVRLLTGLRTPTATRESANKSSPGTEENRESYRYKGVLSPQGLPGAVLHRRRRLVTRRRFMG